MNYEGVYRTAPATPGLLIKQKKILKISKLLRRTKMCKVSKKLNMSKQSKKINREKKMKKKHSKGQN